MPRQKPDKPYPDFPLFAHASGQWAKKIRGKMRYFGVWSDPNSALQEYLRIRDHLQAGVTPPTNEGLTIADLVEEFLAAKRQHLDAGEIGLRSWEGYLATCKRVVAGMGPARHVADLRPADFASLRDNLADGRGLISLGNEIQRVRSLFKFAADMQLIDRPLQFGPQFRKPAKAAIRKHRQASGAKMFSADDLRAILAVAKQPLRSMILLAINCGFGPGDLSHLPTTAITGDWIDWPRPKTGANRRAWLWPETIASLAGYTRPTPRTPDLDDRVFLTRYGNLWVKHSESGVRDDAVNKEFAKAKRKTGVSVRLGFYAIRHTFATVAGATLDQPAIDVVMGHIDQSMAANYRQMIGDDRIRHVCQHVREWLFPGE